ncbi:hypothetical protein POG14_05610 [Clostridium paraputrificum]|uniref:hypothetical protein n=1 Tax=Clostridium paraputrificum TaxID=29363 RepID=UPI00189876D7|nr:hypothetical protein [Clostridium paraputrificum]MDC0801654.1 hypothetical protein [Clostridium paraputrificum]
MINRKYFSIKNNKDIEKLMEKYNYFHDSCISEISYESGTYVNEDLSMQPINDKRILKVVFQRQGNPRNLEIKFNKLVRLNLFPESEDYDSIIFGATMEIKDGNIYWINEENVPIDRIDNYRNYTFVIAKEGEYRFY